MGTSEVPRGQRSLFQEPYRDPIWHCEQLRRMAAEGYYWTPEGPRNGVYVPSASFEVEKSEPSRARPRNGRSKKPLA